MNQDARHRLEEILDREVEAAHSLAATLAAERLALTGDSPDAVVQKAAEKVENFRAIEKLEAERRSLCAAPQAPGIADTIAARWRALMELMAGCRTANDVNGHIIHVRQHQIRQLLDIVRGDTPSTYGPQGKTVTKALRALAQA